MRYDLNDLRVPQIETSLRVQTINVLRQAILGFHFKPGERLVERVLCEKTGVSRTSIREALRQLEAEGLVRIIPNRGPIVAIPSLDEVAEIYELRAALEGLACRLIIERAGEEIINNLVSKFEALKHALHAEDASELSLAGSAFYDAFIEGCGNKPLYDTAKAIQARVIYLRASAMQQAGRGANSVAEIERMVKAIQRRDPIEAQMVCEEHLRQAHSAAVIELRRHMKSIVEVI